MIRKIIKIDEEKCNGCALCVSACHEGAIGLVGGKARLLRDDYCDGLGNCLPACPAGAISFVEREAAAFDEAAAQKQPEANWPIQLKLTPESSPRFGGCHLLIAADCTAFAAPALYNDFRRRKPLLVGCPKLDNTDYSEKLSSIFKAAAPESITVLRMEVPCCGGLEFFVKKALESSGVSIPLETVTFSVRGERV